MTGAEALRELAIRWPERWSAGDVEYRRLMASFRKVAELALEAPADVELLPHVVEAVESWAVKARAWLASQESLS